MGLDRNLEGRSIVINGRTADADTTVVIAPAALGTKPADDYVASVASTDNTNDKAAGTGGLTAIVRGIAKTTFLEVEELITLNGTTAVLTTAEFIRINEIILATVGTNGSNTGTITATLNSQTQATMPIGYSRSNGLFYTVPAGQFLAIDRINLTGGELATGNVVRWQLQARYLGASIAAPDPWYVLDKADMWSPSSVEYGHELIIPQKSELRVVAVTAVNNAVISGSIVATLGQGNTPTNFIR